MDLSWSFFLRFGVGGYWVKYGGVFCLKHFRRYVFVIIDIEKTILKFFRAFKDRSCLLIRKCIVQVKVSSIPTRFIVFGQAASRLAMPLHRRLHLILDESLDEIRAHNVLPEPLLLQQLEVS